MKTRKPAKGRKTHLMALDRLTATSKATDADVDTLAEMLKKGIAKKHKKMK